MDHVTGKSWGCFGVSNHRDMSRWFEKFPRQVGNQPVCIGETGKSATSRTNQRGRHGFVADLSPTSLEVGIVEFGLNAVYMFTGSKATMAQFYHRAVAVENRAQRRTRGDRDKDGRLS